ncbi:MAG: S8 family peptidase, partial [Solirubrobacterales bacterium]
MKLPQSKSRLATLRRAFVSAFVVVTVTTVGGVVGVQSASALTSTIVDGAEVSDRRVFVRFESGTDYEEREAVLDEVDGERIRGFSLVPRLDLVRLPAGADVEQAVIELAGEPGVAYAELEPIRQLSATTPNDPYYSAGYMWGQNNTGQSFTLGSISYTGTVDADMDAPQAWDLTRGSSQVTVGVIDSGIQLSHPDLAGNLWSNPGEIPANGIDDDGNGKVDDYRGWDFVNGDSNPDDDDGHGTHVAGTVGARGNNSTGVTGLNWTVQLAALKACDATGSCPLSATIAALNYAVNEGIMVSNNSYGGLSSSEYLPEKQALAAARTAGHLFVAAAGNDNVNTDPPNQRNFPSGYDLDNIISVAATTLNDGRASYSNYGATTVDVGAPGSQIVSTYTSSTYVGLNGTSMASPQVAGLAALIKSRKPTWTYAQIRSQIMNNTRLISALSGESVSGGVVNAFDALNFAPDPPTITAGPSGQTASTVATFSFSGETVGAGVTFECRIDSGAWASCASPKPYTALTQGPHSFQVRQTDQAANTSTEATSNWSVDTVAPAAPSITTGPSGPTASTAATFSFSGETVGAGVTFEC